MSKFSLSSIITPRNFVNGTCFILDFPSAILIESVLILARWKSMKCDFETFKVSLFSVSHVDIFYNSEFRISIADTMLSPSIKTLVSSANKIGNISFETLLRSLIYIMNKSGPSTEPWGTPQVITLV